MAQLDLVSRTRGSDDRDADDREAQQRDGIDRSTDRATPAHLEVQVRGVRVARAAHRADHLAANDPVADLQPRCEGVEVVISVPVADVVFEDPGVSLPTAESVLFDQHTVDARNQRMPGLGIAAADVDPLMNPAAEALTAEVVQQDQIGRQLDRKREDSREHETFGGGGRRGGLPEVGGFGCLRDRSPAGGETDADEAEG